MPSLPRGFRIVYPLASVTGFLASFAFPAVIFIFFTRPDVKQIMRR
jgi:hypothetical protein